MLPSTNLHDKAQTISPRICIQRAPIWFLLSARADYVYVDWDPDFALNHSVTFPEAANPGLFVGLGPLALGYILKAGGTGYFRMRAVKSYLDNGQLHRVHDAPEFSYPAYAVYGTNTDETIASNSGGAPRGGC